MPFAPGDRVHVLGWGKGIVREVRKGTHYVVEVNGVPVRVAAAQVESMAARKRRPPRRDEASGTTYTSAVPRTPAAEIDLHGMTAAEAVTALDAFLDRAILDGFGSVRVIHGRSGGRLKSSVHARLRAIPSVRGFELDPGNPGVTIVAL